MQDPLSRTPSRAAATPAILAELVLAVGLAACGGGGGGDTTVATSGAPVPGAPPPASAQGPGAAPVPAPSASGPSALPPSPSVSPAPTPTPAPAAAAQPYAFLVLDPIGQAGARSLNAAGQVAYNTDTGSRFFDGSTTREIAGGLPSRASAVNDAGQVTGFVTRGSDPHLFFWSAQDAGAFNVLDTDPGVSSVGNAINQRGQVAGTTVHNGIATAFRWTQGVGFDTLPAIGAPAGSFPSASALFINASGAVAGGSTVPDARTRAALWVPGAPVRDLGSLGGSESTVSGINDATQVIGSADVGGGIQHAFRWTDGEGMRDLGTLGGTSSGAAGINGMGWVIGTATTADGRSLAFLWRPDTGLQSLGTLGGPGSSATAINASGQVAGVADLPDGTTRHAFLWSADTGMVDLNTLLEGADPPVLQSVIALADNGTMLASSQRGLVLLRPKTP